MTPVVSALLTLGGVITSVLSSVCGVRSPFSRRIAGVRFVSGLPLQSLNFTFTGKTWPFLSLSVTDALVIGARNWPVPTATTVVAAHLERRRLASGRGKSMAADPRERSRGQ